MALAMAERCIHDMAVKVAGQRSRDDWKAVLYTVPEDLRAEVNRRALATFHKVRRTTV